MLCCMCLDQLQITSASNIFMIKVKINWYHDVEISSSKDNVYDYYFVALNFNQYLMIIVYMHINVF